MGRKNITQLQNEVAIATDEELQRVFLEYCLALVDSKEHSELTEEEIAYKIIDMMLTKKLSGKPELEDIFDIASSVEIPRTSSYQQPIGEWDQKTACNLKQKDWEQLVAVIRRAQDKLEERRLV